MISPAAGLRAALAAAAVFVASSAHADVIFSILNTDAPGEGFNDPSAPLLPAPGNDTAATLGEQRLNALQFAADLWAQSLDNNGAGDITVIISATFAPAACNANGGNLGSAGPQAFFRNFPGAPETNTLYAGALADALRGADLDPGQPDISANFNGDIDRNPNCLGDGNTQSTNWYYGLDTRPPAGTIDFLDTAVHEIGHGIGFVSTVSQSTGAFLAGNPDSYTLNLFDADQQLAWTDMSNAQRLTSRTNNGGLVWIGPQASVTGLSEFLGGIRDGLPRLYAPSVFEPGSSVAHWDTVISPNTFMEPFATGDNRVVETFGIELCAMADIGWPLQPGAQCPDSIDRVSATVGNGSPASCTEAALASAVASGDGRLIEFNCGAAPHTIVLSSPLVFNGGFNELRGNGLITLSGGGSTTVLVNNSSASRLLVRGVNITNGSASNGAGVFNLGTLSIIDSSVSNNAVPGVGGAVLNGTTSAAVNVANSLFANNFAANEGGAIFNFGAAVNIFNSTFAGNESSSDGGAIYTQGTFNGQPLGNPVTNIRSSTFARNNATGGSLTDTGGIVQAINSIFAENATGDVCDGGGSYISRGLNLDDDASCATQFSTNFLTSGNLGLDMLADNGGRSQTIALLAGSDALNAAENTRCAFYPVSGQDQRGELRNAGDCDAGAFELLPAGGDSDGDGIPDAYENANGLDPATDDADDDLDGDGVSNIDEFNAGLAANDVDSDDDSLHDGIDLDPANASNACTGNNAVFSNTIVLSMTTVQCGAPESVVVQSSVTVEPGGAVEIRSPAIEFGNGFGVSSGAQMQTFAQDPATPNP